MNEAQFILDAAAIGISIYTLIQISRLAEKFIASEKVNTWQFNHLDDSLKQLEESIPKELYANGIEPGVYLPKESKEDGAVEYVKGMDLTDWKQLVGQPKG